MKAILHIQTARRDNRTYLQKAYCTPPFKVADITENKKDNRLQLMLMSASPGILDEDEYRMTIELAENTSLQLSTQSYQRLFTMKQGARQHLQVQMATGSSFCFLPHPVVPHKASDFTAVNNIYLSDGCTLIWGEVLTCGRKLNDEIFSFSKYHNVTKICRNDRLVIKENLLIQPAATDVLAMGNLEGYTHQASLIYLNEKAAIQEIGKRIENDLCQQPNIIFGITAAPVNGLIIRLLGQKAEQLHDCLKEIASYLPQEYVEVAVPGIHSPKPAPYAD
jgi:urease accessory protein